MPDARLLLAQQPPVSDLRQASQAAVTGHGHGPGVPSCYSDGASQKRPPAHVAT